VADYFHGNDNMIKVVGIDPGLAGTGIGMVQGRGTTVSGYEFGSIKNHTGTMPCGTTGDHLLSNPCLFVPSEARSCCD